MGLSSWQPLGLSSWQPRYIIVTFGQFPAGSTICVIYDLCDLRSVWSTICVIYDLCDLRSVWSTICVIYDLCWFYAFVILNKMKKKIITLTTLFLENHKRHYEAFGVTVVHNDVRILFKHYLKYDSAWRRHDIKTLSRLQAHCGKLISHGVSEARLWRFLCY